MKNEIFKNKGNYLECNLFENIGIYFTTRDGGVSKEEFETNNMAIQVGDELKNVLKNREKFAKEIKSNLEDFVFANQVHQTKVVKIKKEHKKRGFNSFEDGISKTDAMYTYEKEIPLALFYADCIPIYLVDQNTGLIGLIHAGWQGTVKDILKITIKKLQEKEGLDVSNLKVVVGPSIKSKSFKVKRDVYDIFKNKKYAKGCIKKISNSTWTIDTVKYNLNILEEFGVKKENIYVTNIDTYTAKNLFSYRRDNQTGRMIGVIKKW